MTLFEKIKSFDKKGLAIILTTAYMAGKGKSDAKEAVKVYKSYRLALDKEVEEE